MFNSIPICRSIFDHWIYADAEYLKIWVTMLGKARYLKEDKIGLYQKIQYTLKYGEFIFGRKQWSKDLGIGEQRIRTCIKKLEKDNMIVNVKATSKFTIYSITNYEKFNHQTNHQQDEQPQQLADTTNHHTNHQLTTIQPPSNHQLTTNKEGKEGKEGKDLNIVALSEKLWSLYPNKTGKTRAMTKIPKLIKKYGIEKMENSIKGYMKDVKEKRKTFPQLDYKNGSTFFNEAYEDFVNIKEIEKTKPKFEYVEVEL